MAASIISSAALASGVPGRIGLPAIGARRLGCLRLGWFNAALRVGTGLCRRIAEPSLAAERRRPGGYGGEFALFESGFLWRGLALIGDFQLGLGRCHLRLIGLVEQRRAHGAVLVLAGLAAPLQRGICAQLGLVTVDGGNAGVGGGTGGTAEQVGFGCGLGLIGGDWLAEQVYTPRLALIASASRASFAASVRDFIGRRLSCEIAVIWSIFAWILGMVRPVIVVILIARISDAAKLAKAIAGRPISDILAGPGARFNGAIGRILAGSWRGKPRAEVRASGYVAHSLEAALWSVGRGGDFRQAVLAAANLGEDADTTAVIAGQLAGAAWGMRGLPGEWLERLAWHDRIRVKSEALFDQTTGEGPDNLSLFPKSPCGFNPTACYRRA